MKYKISDEIKKCIVELKLKGFNYNQIKEKVGVSKGSISSILKEYNLSQKKSSYYNNRGFDNSNTKKKI